MGVSKGLVLVVLALLCLITYSCGKMSIDAFQGNMPTLGVFCGIVAFGALAAAVLAAIHLLNMRK